MTLRRALAAADVALVLFATARAGLLVYRAPSWTVDDAYIVARYADNLAHQGVFAWNVDGPRVEGVTSPLVALAGALGSALGFGAIHAMKALGVAALLASGLLLAGLARELRAPSPAGGIAALAYLSVAEHVRHAASGLETEIYLAVEIAAAWAFARALRRPSAATPLFVVALLACLVRPEGAALAVILVGLAALRARRVGALGAFVRRAAAWLALPLVALFALRFAYFHALVPNTYFAKRGSWNAEHARDLLDLGRIYLLDPLLLAAGAAALPAFLHDGRARLRLPSPRGLALVAACTLILGANALAYARADLVMNYGCRFAMHGLPWLAIVLLVVAALGAERARAVARTSRASAAWVFAVAAALVASNFPPSTANAVEHQFARMIQYEATMRSTFAPIADYIVARLPRTATLAVYPDGGLVPYKTGLISIDFGKLSDAYLAREAKTSADVAAYFFALRPDAAMFYLRGEGSGYDAGADAILRDPAFAASYTRAVAVVNEHGSGTALYVRAP